MRVYRDFIEAKNEITRDLAELGTMRFRGYQSKSVDELDREKFTTTELTNYDYTVLQPNLVDLLPTQPWADQEWADRLEGILGLPTNPGIAWQLRVDVWEPLLEGSEHDETRRFSYTYSERLWNGGALKIVDHLEQNRDSRQGFVSIWFPSDSLFLGKRRVPCSLGYDLLIVEDRLQLTYYMRSSDFHTHFDNDCWLALKFQQWAAQRIGVGVGRFTHCVKNLHVYKANVAHVF